MPSVRKDVRIIYGIGSFLLHAVFQRLYEWNQAAWSRMILTIGHQPSGGKEWVAEITGRHPKHHFSRRFLKPIALNWSSTGRTGTTSFQLEEGKVYQVNEPYKGRYFVTVREGRIVGLTLREVYSLIRDKSERNPVSIQQ